MIEDGPPRKGTRIQVRWPDGELYGGVFRGTNSLNMYLVSRNSPVFKYVPKGVAFIIYSCVYQANHR